MKKRMNVITILKAQCLSLSRMLTAAFTVVTMLTALVAEPALAKAPIRSKENVEFRSRAEDEVLSLGKVAEFAGTFLRAHEQNPSFRVADLYAFPKITQTRMDEKICELILQKIYGPKNEITLKIETPVLYQGHTGKTCQASVVDPTPSPKVYERRVIAGFLGAKAYAIVFRFPARSTEAQQEGARKFWSSLR